MKRDPKMKHTWKTQYFRHTQINESAEDREGLVSETVENRDRGKEGKERTG